MTAQDGAGEAREASHGERLARLDRAADYPVTLWVFNPLNRRVVGRVAAWGVSPNAVTVASFAVALCCAALMAWAVVSGQVWAAAPVLLLALWSGQLDALDGDLARYTGRGSPQGAALDMLLDRLTELGFVGAAAWALARTGAEATLAAAVAATGVLFYFYAADAVVRPARRAAVHDRRRYSVVRETRRGAVRFGLFEPFRLFFPAVVAVGFAREALWGAGALFWLAAVWQFGKAVRRPRSDRA